MLREGGEDDLDKDSLDRQPGSSGEDKEHVEKTITPAEGGPPESSAAAEHRRTIAYTDDGSREGLIIQGAWQAAHDVLCRCTHPPPPPRDLHSFKQSVIRQIHQLLDGQLLQARGGPPTLADLKLFKQTLYTAGTDILYSPWMQRDFHSAYHSPVWVWRGAAGEERITIDELWNRVQRQGLSEPWTTDILQ